jgi:hypothetical protein
MYKRPHVYYGHLLATATQVRQYKSPNISRVTLRNSTRIRCSKEPARIPATPPLRLQKHTDLRVHDSRTLATCDMSLGLPTVGSLEAGDFVESLEQWKDDNETRSELNSRLRIQSVGGNVVVNLTISNLIHTKTTYEHHTLIHHDFLRHSWSFIRPSSGRGCKYIKEERAVDEASLCNPPDKIS